MKKDLVEILSIFDKNKTIEEILTIFDKDIEITTTKQVCNKEPELVDLGLPSGNLWMKCNLGATEETDYGNYYQFGSLKGYQGKEAEEHSTWKTCPFNNGKNEFDEEYFLENKHKWFDKDDNLKPEYDAVTQMYGNEYRMPTKQDFQELLDNTISKTIKDYKNSGKNGRLFTSKVNGKTLFVPYSGYVWNGSFYDVDTWGDLWSGRLNFSNKDHAYNLNCSSDYAGLGTLNCCDGFAIRGIKVKRD